MSAKPIRVGLVGAGYIATWHGDAINNSAATRLAAVCDVSIGAAQALAEGYDVPAFASIEDLIASKTCDAVHILTPPQYHKEISIKCSQAGLHCFVEKPFSLSHDDALEMTAEANKAGRKIGVSHNFLGLPSYQRMKTAFQNGDLGRVATAEFNWKFPLAPLRSGPFGLWMLQEPKNLLLELSPHLFAFAVDLFGSPTILHLEMAKPIELSGGGTRYQSWRILGCAGDIDLIFNLSLVETMDDRSVVLSGSSGIARLNFAADTLVTTSENAADIVVNPFLYQLSHSAQHLREGFRNGARHVASLNRKSAYGLSFANTINCFYNTIQNEEPMDIRFDGAAGAEVIQAIEKTISFMPDLGLEQRPIPKKEKPRPKVLVIGGTGFIGRHLTRALVAKGHEVRVLSRGAFGPFDDISDKVETFSTSLKDPEGLKRAMRGIDAVYHLAKSVDTSWEDCLKNDVGVTEGIAQAALDAGVKRFIYTGTIASYDMSDSSSEITEATSFGSDMSDRNLYARSKAACERALLNLHDKQGLPLVIARPGIVVGEGGPLQHWGIGRWQGAGAVRIWGGGNNILPFVLIDDVCDGLVMMLATDAAIGESFNLVGEPMLTAQDYFAEIHKTLGAKIKVKSGNLFGFYIADSIKHLLKKYALGRKNMQRASLKDWQSRAHYSPFRNDHPKNVLEWEPETDRAKFVDKAITNAGLFGF